MVEFTKDLFVWLQVADSPAGEETKTENANTKIKKKPLTLPVLNTLGRSFLFSALFLLLVEESSTKAKTGIFPYRYVYGVFRVLKNANRMLILERAHVEAGCSFFGTVVF